MEQLEADVCIIGGGLTGLIVAQRALQCGLTVVMLERGEDYSAHDTDRSTWWSDRVVGSETGIDGQWTRYANDFPGAAERFHDLAQIESTDDPWAFRYNMRYGDGGSTGVWGGLAWRLHPDDFQTRQLWGYGQDWPISYDDLAPYYDQVDHWMQVSGPDDVDPAIWPWKNNYPFPAFKQSYLDKKLEQVADGRLRLVPQPHAVRNKFEWEGGCIGAKTCVQKCVAGAIFKPNTRMLTEMLFHDNFHLADTTAITHLEASADGARIEVACGVGADGPVEVRGKRFFLAANALENMRILLNSQRVTGTPIANSSGTLGRFFGSHGALTYQILLREPVYPARGRPTTSSCLDWIAHPQRREHNAVVLEVWNSRFTEPLSPWAQMETMWQEQGLWGRRLVERVQQYEQRFSLVYAFELEMTASNTVQLSPTVDQYGLPLARAAIHPTARDRETIDFIEGKTGELAAQPGVDALQLIEHGTKGNYPLGGIRMSRSRESGVVNERCRAHDHDNLYVLGGGAFCSTGSLDPTLTIAALALRALDDPELGWS